jgi:hypothetical protein
MKKKFVFSFILWLFLCIVIPVKGQNSTVLIIEEEFSLIPSQNPVIIGTESKQMHLRSSKAAQINALYDENTMKSFHPLAAQIIKQATGKWEKKISIPENINIEILFSLDNNLGEVAYTVATSYATIENIEYPVPLAQVKFGQVPVPGETISIIINGDVSHWYFDGDSDSPTISANQYDFETAMLRALAHAFGFTSNINRRMLVPLHYNIFDTFLINSNNQRMSDFPVGTDLSGFATGDNVYWKTTNGYKMYAKSPFDRNISLKYFDSDGELMSPEFKAQTGNRNIDSKVTQVMEDIGWSIIPDNSLTIKSNNMNDTTGIGNVNSSYSFYAESSSPVTNYLWTYKIRKNDNSFETIATGSSSTFSISPVTISDSYYRTEYGDLSGKITLQATVNGTPVAADFNIWLEASPANIGYDVQIIKVNEWYYNLEVTAYSAGATNLKITMNNYSVGESLTSNFLNHQYVKNTYSYIYYDYPILIEFKSQNSYGIKTDSYYIDGVSYYGAASQQYTDLTQFNNDVEKYNNIDRKEIYSIMGGLKLTLTADRNIHSTNLISGIYIVKTIYKDGSYSIEKVIKK